MIETIIEQSSGAVIGLVGGFDRRHEFGERLLNLIAATGLEQFVSRLESGI